MNNIGNKACINSLILHLLEMSVFSVRHQIDIIDSKVRHLGRKICTRMAAKKCIILLASGRRELWYGRKSYLVTFTKFMTKKHTEKHSRRKFSNIAKRESFWTRISQVVTHLYRTKNWSRRTFYYQLFLAKHRVNSKPYLIQPPLSRLYSRTGRLPEIMTRKKKIICNPTEKH